MNLQPITKTEFANKSWQRCTDYLFTAKDSVCNLALQELPHAAQCMPIALFPDGELFSAVAVQGVQPGSNYFINTEGRWLGRYIPARYRTYPFVLVSPGSDSDQLVLCIDADSGLIADDTDQEVFFRETGELGETLTKLMDYLKEISSSRAATERLFSVLKKHELIIPWNVQVQLQNGPQRVEGLYCIDEAAFNSLPDDSFVEVRHSGALPVIYCQLFSMHHIAALTRIAQKNLSASAAPEVDELNFDSVSPGGNISFDNL